VSRPVDRFSEGSWLKLAAHHLQGFYLHLNVGVGAADVEVWRCVVVRIDADRNGPNARDCRHTYKGSARRALKKGATLNIVPVIANHFHHWREVGWAKPVWYDSMVGCDTPTDQGHEPEPPAPRSASP
jgi:hypothetical protein